MIRLKIQDVGRQIYASLDGVKNPNISLNTSYSFGEDKEEAIKNLKKYVEDKIVKLKENIKEFENINWEDFDWVDKNGDKI